MRAIVSALRTSIAASGSSMSASLEGLSGEDEGAQPETPPLPAACLALNAPPTSVSDALAAAADAAAFDKALAPLLTAVSSPFAGDDGDAAPAALLALAASPSASAALARAAAAALAAGSRPFPAAPQTPLPAITAALVAAATGSLPVSAPRGVASAAALRTLAGSSAAAAALLLSQGAAVALLDALAALPCGRTAALRREALGAVVAAVSHSPAHALAAARQGCGPRLAALAAAPYAGADAASDALVLQARKALAAVAASS